MRTVASLVLLVALAGLTFLLLRPRGDAPVVGVATDDVGADPAAATGRAPGAVGAPLGGSGASRRTGTGGDPTTGPPDEPSADDAPTTPDGPRVEGTVLDAATGEPVAGAVVVVVSPTTPCPAPVPASVFDERGVGDLRVAASSRRAAGKATTDAAGRFTTRWDEPRADLVVRKPGYVVGTACGVAVNGRTTVRLKRGATIAGVVVSPTGTPVVGAEVDARPPRGLPEVAGRVERAVSGAEGRFVVEGLLAEAFDLAFRHPAFFDEALPAVAAGTKDLRVVMRPAFAVTFRVTTDDKTTPETPTVEWRLAGSPRGEISILVPAAGEGSASPDGDGADPTSAAAPAAPPGGGPVPPDPAAPATPPAQVGTFVFEPLKIPAGRPTATFVVKAIGFEPWTSEPVEVPPEGGATTLDVPLRRDPTLGRARIAVEDREHRVLSFAEEKCSVVLGRRDGKAVPAGVILFAKEAVEFPALEGGPWRFVVRSPRWAPATVDLDVRAAGETEGRAVLSPAARLKVRFFATEPLLVKFRLTSGGEVVWPFVEKIASDGTPAVEETGDEQTSSSGAEGIVLSGLAPGRYVVEGVGADVAVPPTPVDLVEGETKELEITVARR